MSHEMHMQIVKDLPNKKITITRQFNATPDMVWRAWTESELLDQWWAPKPWRAETKTLNFKEGGNWLYAMVGPNGDKEWVKVDFITIEPHKALQPWITFAMKQAPSATSCPACIGMW